MAHFRRAYPLLDAMVGPLVKVFAAKIIAKHNMFMRTQVAKRLALEPSRPDFIDGMKPDHAQGKEVSESTTLFWIPKPVKKLMAWTAGAFPLKQSAIMRASSS